MNRALRRELTLGTVALRAARVTKPVAPHIDRYFLGQQRAHLEGLVPQQRPLAVTGQLGDHSAREERL